ncbi:hypothetical protein MTR_1g034150 [Medicago truncatula]|uniref:Uncharacterized protein n=1 Tax=Medicago truncatula TaxID=3880 RepID=A0A072VRJ3_MEDTR|nr:hypothetical protein MTR_1g034150 [Medicago truncatula]
MQGNPMQKDFNMQKKQEELGQKSLPNKSVYGPLILAISVESSDSPPESLSAGAVQQLL